MRVSALLYPWVGNFHMPRVGLLKKKKKKKKKGKKRRGRDFFLEILVDPQSSGALHTTFAQGPRKANAVRENNFSRD